MFLLIVVLHSGHTATVPGGGVGVFCWYHGQGTRPGTNVGDTGGYKLGYGAGSMGMDRIVYMTGGKDRERTGGTYGDQWGWGRTDAGMWQQVGGW